MIFSVSFNQNRPDRFELKQHLDQSRDAACSVRKHKTFIQLSTFPFLLSPFYFSPFRSHRASRRDEVCDRFCGFKSLLYYIRPVFYKLILCVFLSSGVCSRFRLNPQNCCRLKPQRLARCFPFIRLAFRS